MSSYIEKIKLAVKIIENDLASDLSWREISKKCGISEYHFHRIFSSFMSETPKEFIIRKKLERAISRLAYGGDVNLQDLAFDSGYSSQANFNKAFMAYFGVTPGQVKSGIQPEKCKIGKIKSKYGKDFSIQSLYSVDEINCDQSSKGFEMEAKIKKFAERKVIYRTSENGYVKESIHKTWNDLLESLGNSGATVDQLGKFGVGHDNPQVTPLEKCRYDACVLLDEIENIPSNVSYMSFPAGEYACFHHKGNDIDLLQLYLNIYKNWFSENSREPGNFPLVEKYIFVDKDNLEADIELEAQFLLK